ncbi:MAG: hypothetical protein PHI85_02140 [Victivallaceae bacterium]|nr:hypothetical protein [Victivallaceae bacterium]
MITQTAVSYYGMGSVETAARDFAEMREHGCSTVILAVTEFDFDFWRPNIPLIVDAAHKSGLRVLLDPWGIGKYFGGEQVSLFLQNNVENRQVSALTGEKLPYACFNTNSFRDYFRRICLTLAAEAGADGFFWDEPHYAFPKSYASITGGAGEDWTCRCPVCMKKFHDYYGYEMPRVMNDDVKSFRRREALFILSDTSRLIKELNPGLEITCCVHATLNGYYVSEHRGYDDWDAVAACPWFDVFSTTIINWELPRAFFEQITRRTVEVARKHHKLSERWLMGYYRQPADFRQVDEVVDLYRGLGVDRLAAWTYRGGFGSVLAAPDALRLWDAIGGNYKRVLNQ